MICSGSFIEVYLKHCRGEYFWLDKRLQSSSLFAEFAPEPCFRILFYLRIKSKKKQKAVKFYAKLLCLRLRLKTMITSRMSNELFYSLTTTRFFIRRFFWPTTELSWLLHDFCTKTFLRLSKQNFRVLMYCACALKYNIKSCMHNWKVDNSSQRHKINC